MHLLLGEDAVAAELGLEPGTDEHELLWMRSQVVLASAAAGISPPIASPGPAESGPVRSSTVELRRLGFGGRVDVPGRCRPGDRRGADHTSSAPSAPSCHVKAGWLLEPERLGSIPLA
jgi:hypothetical protein